MRKSLVLAALFCSSAATVHADTSVTLYGIVDGGLIYEKTEGTWKGADYSAKRTGITSGQSGSRWGLKGVEDLGNGTQAVFQLESGFDIATGKSSQGGRLFGRHATVGLVSDTWGQLDFGRQKNIASTFGNPIVDPFDAGFKQSAAAGGSFSSMNTVRYDNQIMYRTPKISGFQAGVGYSFALSGTQSWEVDGEPNDDGEAITAGIRYVRGPIGAFLAYDQVDFKQSDEELKAWLIGGAYDFEVIKVSAAFGRTEDGWFQGRNFGPLSTGSFVVADGLKVDSYLVGMTAPLGNGLLRASWQMANPKQGAQSSTNSAFVGDNLKKQQVYSLGYTYNLSKRTNLYVYGTYAKHALFQDDLDSTLISAGVRHRF